LLLYPESPRVSRMPFVVIITGIPGVGKSTITKLALKQTRANFRLINFGDIMFEEAVKSGLVKHRDEMRKLSPEVQKGLQLKAAEKIVEIARKEPVLIDTHATIRTPVGYLLGFPREVIEIINPNFIVIIEATPSEILGRRLRDLKRDRDVETEEQIARHQDLNRAAAISYAMHSNALIKIIENHEDKGLEEAVNELVEHLIITIVIIAVMLVFFLGWKESLIVTFTVPAILAITLFIAYVSGQTINRITLFAFLLSLGLLVDAAIIVIENIHRHLHAHDSEHKDMDTLLVKATDEIGNPTNIATLAIIMTMIPMAFVGGMMGAFMKPIPLNVPVALIASLLVAYIFTPYLSRKLLTYNDDGAHRHNPHKTQGGM